MTEVEWLTSTDPAPMLAALDQESSKRRLRLFACACCRHIWHLLSEKERFIVESVERYAEGQISAQEMYKVADINPAFGIPNYVALHSSGSTRAARETASPGAWYSAQRVRAFVVDTVRETAGAGGRKAEWQKQVALLRCIFGSPFRPSRPLPPTVLAWNSNTVVCIAKSIDINGDYGQCPILADALLDAGCPDDALIAHLRQPGPHVRGCHVIDLILGRE